MSDHDDEAAFRAEMSAMLDGKTIASWEAGFVRYSFPDEVVLRFTDGTAITITATGYETEGVHIEPVRQSPFDSFTTKPFTS